jgi:hypothetical protein
MARRIYGKLGLARTYALVFGMAYIALALIEDVAARGRGIRSGGHTILRLTPELNVIHWAVGVVVLASYFAGEAAARLVARVVGLAFLVIAVVGMVARGFMGKLLGFPLNLPVSYNAIHFLTAVITLSVGFSANRSRGREAA